MVGLSSVHKITVTKAAELLKRMKPSVTDIYGISPLHYIHAGIEGVLFFMHLLNEVIKDVNVAAAHEFNVALGLILYKGHQKDRHNERSYRTISTCPFMAKALDLYIRDICLNSWNSVTAKTQYQTLGSSHELASLLVTEIIQYSLNVHNNPVYLLVLDAQSAFDRCLRQILCSELFVSGTKGSILNLIDNRLKHRSTVYQWNDVMLGPSTDTTGFEQGGINSSEFYKLYNNEQLKTAEASKLGVDIGSTIVSAVGQADDVILAADCIFNLELLSRLTQIYCKQYRVKLVADKTKLLPVYLPRHKHQVEYSKLTSIVSVDDSPVEFVEEAEHVGIIRSSTGNMQNVLNRISCHKKVLGSLCNTGIAKSQRGNPASSLRIHQLYATPVLLSGLGSLVLNKSEINILAAHHKNMICHLQKLQEKTPRSVAYFLAGTLPFEAQLHQRQLSLLYMVSNLPNDPLYHHCEFILTSGQKNSKSWFLNVQQVCHMYGLQDPLMLLENPPQKKIFKKEVKLKIIDYWKQVMVQECRNLKSLKYFKPELYSLVKPHHLWSTAASNPFESHKATIVAKMISGRYRTDMLCRHWNSSNRSGYCKSSLCDKIPGTLEHIIASCPALKSVRERLFSKWLHDTVMFPSLHSTIRSVLAAGESQITQFVLEPLTFPEIMADIQNAGPHYIAQLMYLTRTFAFYIHRDYITNF